MSKGNWTEWTNDLVQVIILAGIKEGDEFTLSRVYDAEFPM